MASGEAKVACGVVCLLVVVGAFLIGFSFQKVGSNEVGLDYSMNSQTIDFSQLYTTGVHFLGVGHKFIIFPQNVQEVDLRGRNAISARSADGLQVIISGSITYRLITTDVRRVAALYTQFKGDHNSAYRRIARSIIRDVASNFTAFEFFSDRETIASLTERELDTSFNDAHARVNIFTFANVELPRRFDNAITATLAAEQESERVLFEVDSARVTAESEKLQSLQQAQIVVNTGNATASSLLFQANAERENIASIVNATTIALQRVQESVGFTDEELIAYAWLDSFAGARNARKHVQLPRPPLLQI